MLDYLEQQGLLALMEIVGPIALAAALIYGIYHSRRRRGQQREADAATRQLYKNEEARR